MPQFGDSRNQLGRASLGGLMYTKRFDDDLGREPWDRQPIRLNPSLSQEGIAASLRRAFDAAQAPSDNDRDFDELLARLC